MFEGKKAQILYDDPSGRFKKGQLGEIVKNDWPKKYDFKVQLDPVTLKKPLLGMPAGTTLHQCLYFHENEIAIETNKD